MKKLRLLVTKECNRKCNGCCNKDWDLDNLPVCTDYSLYDEIIITGGEPTLRNDLVFIITEIKKVNPTAKILMYTANCKYSVFLSALVMLYLDGITVTLHTKRDLRSFVEFETGLPKNNKSLRLNVFKGVPVPALKHNWIVKSNITWIKNCPLPEDEVFMRYE